MDKRSCTVLIKLCDIVKKELSVLANKKHERKIRWKK